MRSSMVPIQPPVALRRRTNFSVFHRAYLADFCSTSNLKLHCLLLPGVYIRVYHNTLELSDS